MKVYIPFKEKFRYTLGMQPDTPIITALLDACSKNLNVEIAQHVFENIFGVKFINLKSREYITIL